MEVDLLADMHKHLYAMGFPSNSSLLDMNDVRLHDGMIGRTFGPRIAYLHFSRLLRRDLNALCVLYAASHALYMMRGVFLIKDKDRSFYLDFWAGDIAPDLVHQYYAGLFIQGPYVDNAIACGTASLSSHVDGRDSTVAQ